MEAPITSEITIRTGMVLKEIATNKLFRITERLSYRTETPGEDSWRLMSLDQGGDYRAPLILTRRQLAEKYFVEVDQE